MMQSDGAYHACSDHCGDACRREHAEGGSGMMLHEAPLSCCKCSVWQEQRVQC